ncbi:MAG: mechanosensitive ion channel family protein [Clostridia bacterium]|nr:mechanosensitive ion channel family protein [Clostridia bacterium]
MGIAFAEEVAEAVATPVPTAAPVAAGAAEQLVETGAAAQDVWNTIANFATTTGIKIVIAIIILLITFKIINAIGKKLKAKVEKNEKLDKTLSKTLCYIVVVGLKVLVVVCLIGYLGIETSGISALIASLGVGVGLAVNGTLANFAGGALLLITRPFKIGDYISAQGSEGVVEDIRICNTKVITIDNKVVYLPNSALSSGTIVNYSEKDLRRVDLDFSVGGNDPDKVSATLLDACAKEKLVLKDPAPFARMTDYGAGRGVKVTLRAWCNSAEYWDAYFAILNDAQKAFDAAGIVVPFDQLDVHIKNN